MSLLLNDEQIYVALEAGFSRPQKATNLTDEIALKEHEGAKEAVRREALHLIPQIQERLIDKCVTYDTSSRPHFSINKMLAEFKSMLQEVANE